MSMTVKASDWHSTMPWIDRPGANIQAYVHALPPHERDWAEHYLTAWRRDGIVVFEKSVSDTMIDAILGDVDYLVRHHRDFELAVEVGGRQFPRICEVEQSLLLQPGTKYNNLHTISHAVVAASLNATVMRFLRHVFADQPLLMQTLTFFRGSQQPVHVDYPYVRNQTQVAHIAASWLALEDVSVDAGALAYWPGAHDVNKMGFYDWGGGSILMEADSSGTPDGLCDYLAARLDTLGLPKLVFAPRRGDVLLWHGSMPHEGTAINDLNLTRKSLVSHFTSGGAYPQHFMKPDAVKQGHVTEANGGAYYHYNWLDNPRQLPSAP